VQGCVILVEVGKLPRETRKPKKLWLWWSGEGEVLALIWRAYCRRFDLEHTIRFMKQTLGWSAPRFRHPEQDDRWTWLVEPSRHEMRARTAAEQARVEWLKERVARRKKGTDFPST
jgi:hypothetical protein